MGIGKRQLREVEMVHELGNNAWISDWFSGIWDVDGARAKWIYELFIF